LQADEESQETYLPKGKTRNQTEVIKPKKSADASSNKKLENFFAYSQPAQMEI